MQLYAQNGNLGIRLGNRFVAISSELFDSNSAVPFDDEATSEFLDRVAEAINFDLV